MAGDIQFRLSSEISDENAIERVKILAMMEQFENRGQTFFTTDGEIVVKLPQADLYEIIETALAGMVTDSDEYHVRRSINRYNGSFVLGKKLDPTNDVSVVPREYYAKNDLIRMAITPADNSYDYETDRYVSSVQDPDCTDSRQKTVLSTTYWICGEEEMVVDFERRFLKAIKDHQDKNKSSLVNWLYSSGHGTGRRVFQISKTWGISPTFYPWIDRSLKEYYESFLASQAQILVLWGPPGTGKTSWVRDMLCEMNLNAFISYDAKVLMSDSTFVSYMLDPLYNAIIMEDADDFLTATRQDNNKFIAKILNISDGLIKLPRKKLIFSTNLPSVAQIDKAIIRPGRCFDVMEFRRLSNKEAKAAANYLNIELEGSQSSYSLAEVFGMKIRQQVKDPLLTSHGSKFDQGIGFLR